MSPYLRRCSHRAEAGVDPAVLDPEFSWALTIRNLHIQLGYLGRIIDIYAMGIRRALLEEAELW